MTRSKTPEKSSPTETGSLQPQSAVDDLKRLRWPEGVTFYRTCSIGAAFTPPIDRPDDVDPLELQCWETETRFTVADLLEILRHCPPDLPVFTAEGEVSMVLVIDPTLSGTSEIQEEHLIIG